MQKKRFLLVVMVILSIVFASSFGFAKERNYIQPLGANPNNTDNLIDLKKIGSEKIDINMNAPMKLAVDKYMQQKKAEEEARARAKEEARMRAEASQKANTSAASKKSITTNKPLQTGSAPANSAQSKQAQAEQILASLIAKNPILIGTTIFVKDCPHNWQGCTYYKSAVIWIDPDHRAPLEKIITHECNHIIDWRSDGDIDNNDYHE